MFVLNLDVYTADRDCGSVVLSTVHSELFSMASVSNDAQPSCGAGCFHLLPWLHPFLGTHPEFRHNKILRISAVNLPPSSAADKDV